MVVSNTLGPRLGAKAARAVKEDILEDLPNLSGCQRAVRGAAAGLLG
jgi:hypothetical protein